MAKRTTDSKIVPQCANCCLPDFSEGYCTAFSDPDYQWRNGECWGKCRSAQEMVARLEAMVNYALPRANIAPIRHELEEWRETVRELEAFDNYYDGREFKNVDEPLLDKANELLRQAVEDGRVAVILRT